MDQDTPGEAAAILLGLAALLDAVAAEGGPSAERARDHASQVRACGQDLYQGVLYGGDREWMYELRQLLRPSVNNQNG